MLGELVIIYFDIFNAPQLAICPGFLKPNNPQLVAMFGEILVVQRCWKNDVPGDRI